MLNSLEDLQEITMKYTDKLIHLGQWKPSGYVRVTIIGPDYFFPLKDILQGSRESGV